MPEKTLRAWLSEQQAPAHIQQQIAELLSLPERLRKDAESEWTPNRVMLIALLISLAGDLDDILGEEEHDHRNTAADSVRRRD